MTKVSQVINDPNYTSVLNAGFVGYVDHMGSDADICKAARLSYGEGTKSVSEDRGLIRYLIRHRHCYHPSMQVLTANGWKAWESCNKKEVFLIPDPITKTYLKEELTVKQFDADEQLYCFYNNRMSYKVTSDHKMWFKQKCQNKDLGLHHYPFEKVKVQEKANWGWFEPITEYVSADLSSSYEADLKFCFIGFFLGDGSYASTNTITFHLKKSRKKKYLENLLNKLNISFSTKKSFTHKTAKVYNIETPDFLRRWVSVDNRAKDKTFSLKRLSSMPLANVAGLFNGLLNSDGHYPKDRKYITFSSCSKDLTEVVSSIAPVLGYDAHYVSVERRDIFCINIYPKGRTTLESRKKYHTREHYCGKVYCATSSTGLLVVRGGEDKFGFICGNTSPIEMGEIKIHIKLPIFVMRQLVRHRTANMNEYSGRYSEMVDEFYIPEIDQIKPQSLTNKQGRAEQITFKDDTALAIQQAIRESCESSYNDYQVLLGKEGIQPGIARETARIVLPGANYTEIYWKQDLHNMLHMLKLRMDSHAQWEIREFAQAIYNVVEPLFPATVEAWQDYVNQAVTLSRMDQLLMRDLLINGKLWLKYMLIDPGKQAMANKYGMGLREFQEFLDHWEIRQ